MSTMLRKGNFFKKLIAVVLVIVTMLPYFPISALAADNQDESQSNDYYSFGAKWEKGNTTEKITVETGPQNIKFNANFSGKPVFNNLVISARDITENTALPAVNISFENMEDTRNNGSSLIFTKSIAGGNSYDGTLGLSFNKTDDFSEYDKKIQITLEGEYVYENETVAIEEVRVLEVHVVPSPDVSYFGVDPSFDISKANVKNKWHVDNQNWGADYFDVTTTLNLLSENSTYVNARFKINRTNNQGINPSIINNEDNLIVTVNNDAGCTYNISRESDGNTYITFTRGVQLEEEQLDENVQPFSCSTISFTTRYVVVEDTHENDDIIGSGSTTFSCSVDLNVEGVTITRNSSGTEYEKRTYTYNRSKQQNVQLWFKNEQDYYNAYKVFHDGVNRKQSDLLNDLDNNKLNVQFKSQTLGDIFFTGEPGACRLVVYNYNRDESYRRASLTYKESSGEEKTFSIDTDKMSLSSINIDSFDNNLVNKVEFYNIDDVAGIDTPFLTVDSSNYTMGTYNIPNGTNIYEYYVIVTGYKSQTWNSTHPYSSLINWTSTWNIDVDYLNSSIGENNVKNIRSITREQEGKFKWIKHIDGNPYVADYDYPYENSNSEYAGGNWDATSYIEFMDDNYESYCELGLNDYDGNISTLGVKERNKKVKISFTSETVSEDNKNVKNEEPKLFLRLPNEYDYSNFKVSLDDKANGYLYIKNYDCQTINGDKYLIIDLGGTFNSTEINGKDIITVTHDRMLKTTDIVWNPIEVDLYMITNNENYTNGRTWNENNLSKEKNGINIIPEYVMNSKSSFTVAESDHVNVTTFIYNSKGKKFAPGINKTSTGDEWEITSEQNPLLMNAGSEIKYETLLKSTNEELGDIDLIIRLPKSSNKAIKNDDDLKSSISLTLKSLEDISIQLRENRSGPKKINSSEYDLLYSTNENAKYDDEFTELDSTVDLNTVKTLRVKFKNFKLQQNQNIIINYKMIMPDAEGISGATTAVRYTKDSLPEPILESTPAYVKHGNPQGTIHLEKLFEGYDQGVVPAGESTLANIKFQLINIDTNEPLVLAGQTTQEVIHGNTYVGVFETNSEGKATLTDVPEGTYKLVELSTFANYRGINYVQIDVLNGVVENDPIKVENVLKKGNLTIHKKWEGTNIQPYDVYETIKLKLTRQGDGLEYTAEKCLNRDTGSVTFEGIPYGTYTISEESNVPSWFLDSVGTTVTVNSPNQETTVQNKMKRGTITIEKEMPGEDDVRDITLKITGELFKYVNEDGVSVNYDTETTLNIGDYYNNPTSNDIRITLNDDTKPTKATIVMENMPVGTYTVKEVDIPKIEGTDIDKYEPITKRGYLTDDELLISLTNNWKTGTLKIRKTAEEGVDLTNFRVRVRMVNPKKYNTNYDQDFQIPANGILTIPGLYLGTYSITEYESDYFTPRYGDNQSYEPIEVEITENQTTEAVIYNQATYGYVKLYKSLEDNTAENTVGFKFKLTGKDATGKDITEVVDGQTVNGITKEITSEQMETLGDGKTYGYVVFGPVQAGGDYQVSEVDTPDIYREMDPVQVDIKKTNTIDNPVVIKVNNERKRGNLEMITRTVPEGGPLSPIKYKVTEITLNPDATTTEERMVRGKVVAELDGVSGYAELLNIYAGTYLVELTEWPSAQGYTGDLPQIVEVPDLGTGRAEFEIEKPDLQNTRLVIEKKFVNQNGDDLTSEDFTKARLNENEEFEAKVTNVTTGKVYYTFFSKNNPGVIKGLPAGDYEVEEVFKPKYTPEQSKYTVTIEEPASQEEGSVTTVTIKNLLNTEFGFGGQDSKNNMSKQTAAVINKTSRTVIYIADEDDDPVTGAEFKLYDSLGREVGISFDDNKYVVNQDKRLIVNGLPVGRYTVKCLSVPAGYDKPADKVFDVYEGATLVTRMEVLKTRPRGNLRLSTVYNKNGTEKNTPRSKYKILDPVNGKVLTFEKTGDGNYIRSNKQDATDTISLKASSVLVKDVEVGTYEVGLVDLSEQFGVINEQVETVNVAQSQTTTTKVTVKERTGFKKVVTSYYTGNGIALREDGELFGWTIGDDYELHKLGEKYPNIAGVKAKDVYMMADNNVVIIAEDGKLWSNIATGLPEGVSADGIICLSDVEDYPLYGIKFTKASIAQQAPEVYAIDESGKVWFWGNSVKDYESSLVSQFGNKPICISNYGVLNEKDIVDIDAGFIYRRAFAVDSKGNVYSWGYANAEEAGLPDSPTTSEPVCINTTEGSSLADVKIKRVYTGEYATFFIDYDDNLWVCGKDDNSSFYKLGSESLTGVVRNPVCLTKLEGNPLNGKKIKSVTTSYYDVAVTDSDGKVWYWGYCSINNLGANGLYYEDRKVAEPMCLSTHESSKIKGVRFKDVVTNYDSDLYGLDENGSIWVLRGQYGIDDVDYLPLGTKQYATRQTIVDAPQNAYFDLFEVQDMSINTSNSIIRDKSGKLWAAGSLVNYPIYGEDNSAVDYLGSELGAALGNIKVKKYECGDSSTLILDETGKLWTIGQVNNLFTEKKTAYNGYEQLEPICVTERTDCVLHGKTIVDIAVSKEEGCYELIAVVDSDGNLYTAGYYNVYGLGYTGSYTDNSYYESEFRCLNTMYSINPKFTKVFVNGNKAVYAIDKDGLLWAMGYKSSYYNMGITGRPSDNSYINAPFTVSSSLKVKDVAGSSKGGLFITEDGDLYVWGEMVGYNNQPISTGFAAVNGQNTIMEGKHFVKVAAGGNGNGTGLAMDDNGQIYQIFSNSVYAISNINQNIYTDYGRVIAKDFYVGPNTVVIKDIYDDIYAVYEKDQVSGQDGTQAGMAVKLSGSVGNPLYNKTISKQISSNVVSVIENEVENVYVLDAATGKVKGTTALNGISSFVNKDSYTVIFDNENHMYFKDGFYFRLSGGTDVVISNKDVLERDDFLIVQDTQGNSYKVVGNTSTKLENAQLHSVVYEKDNVIIMDDLNGNYYVVGGKYFKKIEGFDANTKIKNIYEYTKGTQEIVFFQDTDNNLWLAAGNTDGTQIAGTGTYRGFQTASGVTDLGNAQKVTNYSGGEVKDIILDGCTYVLDKTGKLHEIYSGNDTSSIAGTVVETANIVSFKTYAGYTKMALDADGNLYSWGEIQFRKGSTRTKYGRIGDSNSSNSASQFWYNVINLSTEAGLGTVKSFEVLNSAAIVELTNNKVYLCLVGSDPIATANGELSGIKEVYDKSDSDVRFYVEYNNGLKYSITGNVYYGTASASIIQSSTSEPSTSEQAPSGLVVENGKLYLYTNNGTTKTCITDKAAYTDMFAKQFKLIRDSKFKLN